MGDRFRRLVRQLRAQHARDHLSEEPLSIPYDPFEIPIANGTVSLYDLVQAKTLSSPILTFEPSRLAVGRHYYSLLLAAFQSKHKDAQVVIQNGAGIGAFLPAGNDAELELLVLRSTIRYDWTEPRRLEDDLAPLDDDAKRWLRPAERRSLQLALFSIATQVHTSIGRENKQHPPDEQPGALPTPHLATELADIGPQIARAREKLYEDAPRAAQVVYAQGMALGAGLLGTLCAIVAAVFYGEGVAAVNGIAFLAGGVGACLSVLQRMTSGSLALDYKVGPNMLKVFGGVRPFVGGAFGMVTFCAIKAGLLSGTLVIPRETSGQLAFFAFFGFIASFNERFFQDMLRTASPGLGSESSTET
jgi:hypothetical protein